MLYDEILRPELIELQASVGDHGTPTHTGKDKAKGGGGKKEKERDKEKDKEKGKTSMKEKKMKSLKEEMSKDTMYDTDHGEYLCYIIISS